MTQTESKHQHQPSEEELNECCRVWQKRLRISDWRISVELANSTQMDTASQNAECLINVYDKVAKIKIPDYASWSDWSSGYDPELYVVHELIHLVVIHWKPDEDSQEFTEHELAINLISESLVNGYRE